MSPPAGVRAAAGCASGARAAPSASTRASAASWRSATRTETAWAASDARRQSPRPSTGTAAGLPAAAASAAAANRRRRAPRRAARIHVRTAASRLRRTMAPHSGQPPVPSEPAPGGSGARSTTRATRGERPPPPRPRRSAASRPRRRPSRALGPAGVSGPPEVRAGLDPHGPGGPHEAGGLARAAQLLPGPGRPRGVEPGGERIGRRRQRVARAPHLVPQADALARSPPPGRAPPRRSRARGARRARGAGGGNPDASVGRASWRSGESPSAAGDADPSPGSRNSTTIR